MPEALVSTMGDGRFQGFSAGSKPGGKVNPLAIEQVKKTGNRCLLNPICIFHVYELPDTEVGHWLDMVCSDVQDFGAHRNLSRLD